MSLSAEPYFIEVIENNLSKELRDKVPVAEWDEQFTKMLDCYYESFDFSDRSTIQPLIERVEQL